MFPDVIPSKQAQFATMCPSRTPEFKVHTSRGLAHSAISNKLWNEEIAMYEFKGNAWVKIYEYIPGDVCADCGGTMRVNNGLNGWMARNTPYGHTGKLMDTAPVCNQCYQRDRNAVAAVRKEVEEREQLKKLQEKYN